MRIGDQFNFHASVFNLNRPSYRDILSVVSPTSVHSLSEGKLVVGVDEDNSIISAKYHDGTTMIRNPSRRGGYVILVASPDGSHWYMNAPDCWLRLD